MSQSLEQGKRKLTAKDAITAGALGAVCIAIRFLFMLVGGVSPYVWFATHFIDAILIGPVFMLMVAKVQKNGPFLLTSLITGVVLVAATWMFPITGLVGGILCVCACGLDSFGRNAGLLLLQSGLYRGLSAPLVYQRKLFGVCRPDDGRWLYGHHGGPADLAGVRGHCTEHFGRLCSGLLAGYETHA